jgi:predicted hotdog family 3-hydroxylacyl-ACP dehydratase
MRLLSAVLEHGPGHTTCSADVAASALFRLPDGSVPAWLGLEYMAQCAAVHGGLELRARGQSPRPGLFLGSRRVALHVDRFAPGARLRITARHHRGETGLVAFDCRVQAAETDRTLAEGRLNVYVFRDWAALEEGIR